MADVNDIIAHGFGSWSGVNSVPTLGFGTDRPVPGNITWQPGTDYHNWKPTPTDRTCYPNETPELGKDTWTPRPQNV